MQPVQNTDQVKQLCVMLKYSLCIVQMCSVNVWLCVFDVTANAMICAMKLVSTRFNLNYLMIHSHYALSQFEISNVLKLQTKKST